MRADPAQRQDWPVRVCISSRPCNASTSYLPLNVVTLQGILLSLTCLSEAVASCIYKFKMNLKVWL